MNTGRKEAFLIATGCLLITSIVAAQDEAKKDTQPEWLKKYNDREINDLFHNPPMFYAPHTFWFWDDVIKDEHTAASMAEQMAKQGLNPGYAHPRSGFDNSVTALPVEQYLAEPWFTSFSNALQTAKQNGLTLGYCDEYNWPSGQAAGKVLQKHPELEATYLSPRRYYASGKTEVKYDSVDFVVAGKLINKQIDASSLRVIGEGKNIRWTVPPGDWMIYTYTIKTHQGIDGGKVNYLDPKLMEVFMPLVHEQYDKHFKNEMGKGIPGVFVDNEGDFGWKMAWSEHLAGQYQSKKKRDIRTWLPLLTEKDKDGLFVVARCDWFDVVSDVYNESYFKPLVSWLKERNMYYISNLWEESLQLQTIAVGDLMRTTRYATMPGNDCLEMKSQDVHDFKEVQSVAEFEDRPLMSEIMGVAGWIQSPEMMKMSINSVTSFGVSHVVPHGIYMNRQLETIPFPSDWFTDNPYWNYLHQWTDFARRAAFITRQSRLVADVLLVNPLETVWSFSENYFSEEKGVQNAPWDPRVVETDQVYADAMRKMNRENIDFLIADKYYLAKGAVQPVKGNAKITINNHDFRAIVLPATYVIPRSSFKKIFDFAKQGGLVVLLGELPQGSPEKGLNDKTIISQANALKQFPNVINLASGKDKMDTMVAVLNKKMEPQIRLENSGRLYTAQRKIGHTNLYWFANNTDTLKHFTAWVRDGKGVAEIWDCETGEKKNISSANDGKYQKVSLTLQPFEAYWLAFNPENTTPVDIKQPETGIKEKAIDTKWTLSYPDGNTVCKTTAKVLYSDASPMDNDMLQSGYNDSNWKYYSRKEENENKSPYSYWRMNIPVGAKSVIVPSYLLGKEIWLNDKKMSVTDSLIPLAPESGLLSFVLNRKDEKLSIAPFKFKVGTEENKELASWYTYGLQQYTGFLEYETQITINDTSAAVSIDLGEVKYMAEVFVNGKSVGARLWPPFKFDISGALKPGDNKIKVRIGNLIANEMWMKEDMGKLRTWGWQGIPDLNQYDAGLFGPVKLVFSSK